MTQGPAYPQDWQPPPEPPQDWQPSPPLPAYAYRAPVEHPRGVLVFVLGILSVLGMGFFGPFAWALGRSALREIDAVPGVYNNRGVVQAGMVLGIVGTVLLVIGVVALLMVVTIMSASLASSRG